MSEDDVEKLVKIYAETRTEAHQVLVRTILQKNLGKLQPIIDAWDNIEDEKGEDWKQLSEVFPEGKEILEGYEVSTMGRFRNRQGKIMSGSMIETGYMRVRIGKEEYRKPSHRYVAMAFLSPVEGKNVVHHINAIPFDNRVSNLQWTTSSENTKAGWEDGGGNKKRLRPVREVDEDGKEIATYNSIVEAAEKTGLLKSNIHAVCSGRAKRVKERYFQYIVDEEKKEPEKPKKTYGGYTVGLFNVKTNRMVKGPYPTMTATGVKNVSTYIKKGTITREGNQWRKILPVIDNENSDEKWVQFRKTPYYVSNMGKVRDEKGNILRPYMSNQGEYHKITLVIDRKNRPMQLSRVVAEAFIPLPNGFSHIDELQVDHINRKTLDNRVENLRWLTRKENIQEANNIPVLQIDLNGNIIGRFKSVTEAAKHFGVTTANISASCTKKVNSCQNFIFRHDNGTYNDEEKQYILDMKCIGRNHIVLQLDEDGNCIKRWLGVQEVAKFCNLPYTTMVARIKNNKETNGYFWKRASDI